MLHGVVSIRKLVIVINTIINMKVINPGIDAVIDTRYLISTTEIYPPPPKLQNIVAVLNKLQLFMCYSSLSKYLPP